MDHLQSAYLLIGIINTVIVIALLIKSSGRKEAQYITREELHAHCMRRHGDNSEMLSARFEQIDSVLEEIKSHLDQVSRDGDRVAKSVASIQGYLSAIAKSTGGPPPS